MPDARRRWARGIAATALLALAQTLAAASAIDGFDLPDAETTLRYQALIAEFRCPKCLNEALASSGAPIAVDLRRTVRNLLAQGKTDAEIRAHLQRRYGDFILYDPPLTPRTWALWFAPAALLASAVFALWRVGWRRSGRTLTAAERRRVERFLETPGD